MHGTCYCQCGFVTMHSDLTVCIAMLSGFRLLILRAKSLSYGCTRICYGIYVLQMITDVTLVEITTRSFPYLGLVIGFVKRATRRVKLWIMVRVAQYLLCSVL